MKWRNGIGGFRDGCGMKPQVYFRDIDYTRSTTIQILPSLSPCSSNTPNPEKTITGEDLAPTETQAKSENQRDQSQAHHMVREISDSTNSLTNTWRPAMKLPEEVAYETKSINRQRILLSYAGLWKSFSHREFDTVSQIDLVMLLGGADGRYFAAWMREAEEQFPRKRSTEKASWVFGGRCARKEWRRQRNIIAWALICVHLAEPEWVKSFIPRIGQRPVLFREV
ncbi:hypothetical protein GLAREA_09000 [Glarea lozoyensis ATCC 20868]|uniref:Uncharacterized protein n=1 Tax=Glarea lozoyensis (strain ATCC 20868 / MF5171) TaxID=1116229 RepID=S3DEL7_GLAL2|nr:uncharacterized protein GLAREA_09000 [Glarea lozoyensis ATCC 20868]EPE36837.1 hypothetical protein GLAREA_09000 [Glarea lozoyensis ATCC 20868]